MKYYLIYLSALLLQGCLYFNDRGISGSLYNKCHESYDACGKYKKECDGNIIDYNNTNTQPSNNINILDDYKDKDTTQCQVGISIDKHCTSR